MKKQIVLVSTGVFQNYILKNINQLLKLGFDIHVIIDLPFFGIMEKYKSYIKLIDTATLHTNFDKKSKLDKKHRNGFWNNASKRLFLVYEYMKMNNLKNVIHLENDILLYSNMNYNFDEKIYITMDSKNRCIPGIIYIPKYDLFTKLIENYDFTKNDMINLAKFYTNNKDIVKTFPIIDDSIDKCIYNANFQEFNCIFDGAAIGQYLGGVDPRNISGDTTGFVNETCEIKYDKYTFKWLKKGNYYFPYIEINNKLIPINNLHIHCKKLENFRMENPVENKYIEKYNMFNYNIGKMNNHKLDSIFHNFFIKQSSKSKGKTLANYNDNTLIPGGENGSFYTHICYHTIYKALFELIKQDKNEYTFVETGCSAHGTKSTLLWDKFVNIFGGKVLSVDLNENAVNITNNQTSDRTNVTHSDSLDYLPTITDKIDFLYLDSYDVNFLNPLPSAEHHLKEFNSIKHLLHEDSIVLVDDTPVSPEWLDNGKSSPIYHKLKVQFDENMSGKGSLVCKELEKMGATKIMHQYQVLWKINKIQKVFDIVIPVGPNDKSVIEQQIKHTKKNIIGYRNIYLICYDPTITIDGCITINENIFPFNIQTVAKYHGKLKRNGWYLQQLLKLYAGKIIPDILDKYLVIDSDTFFLKPTTFVENNKCLYNYGTEYHEPYFYHMKKLDKDLVKIDKNKSGICHHMIFETKYIDQLFSNIEKNHNDLFYNVFLKLVTKKKGSGASEYEIYFNYMLKYYPTKIKIRKLNWKNTNNIQTNNNLDYISYHWYMRD